MALKYGFKVQWCEENMEKALEELTKGTITLMQAFRKYDIPEGTIRSRRKASGEMDGEKKFDRKQVLDASLESQIADCLRVLCNHGFSPNANAF